MHLVLTLFPLLECGHAAFAQPSSRTKMVNFVKLSIAFIRLYETFLDFDNSGLLAHMDQMRMDPKHQVCKQLVAN